MILESPEFPKLISELEEQMKIAANNLEFESAARIRDKIKSLLKTRKQKDSNETEFALQKANMRELPASDYV